MNCFKKNLSTLIISLNLLLFTVTTVEAQSFSFNDLIKLINTDDKQTIVNFLESKGFIKENQDDLFEYYKYQKFGKFSNESGNGRIILWRKTGVSKTRKITFNTPYVSETRRVYDTILRNGFQTIYDDFSGEHITGYFKQGVYNIAMNISDEILWTTDMEVLKIGGVTVIREDKIAWD